MPLFVNTKCINCSNHDVSAKEYRVDRYEELVSIMSQSGIETSGEIVQDWSAEVA